MKKLGITFISSLMIIIMLFQFTLVDANIDNLQQGSVMSIEAQYTQPGLTTRVSVASDGTQGNHYSRYSSISADGRFVAFDSTADNLVPDDTNGHRDVFVHDRQTGQTTRVSVASDGTEGSGSSNRPSISADGRFVAFDSIAKNLVPGDTNDTSDVFVHDRKTGETTMVSVSSDGTQGILGSYDASISANGRFVAFRSQSRRLVQGEYNSAMQIFVHDRETGETTRVSVSSDGTLGNNSSRSPSISSDGRYVAFHSYASNLVPDDTNGEPDIFVHDRQTGETTRVSISSNGNEGNNGSFNPSISANGRYVAFESWSDNLVSGDTNGTGDVFVHDRQSGETTMVSVSSDGIQGGRSCRGPSISANGRYVAFSSFADNLVPGDTNNTQDVFVHDRLSGETIRASVASDGTEANHRSWDLEISAHGHFVSFHSVADNLVPDDTNEATDVFVHNLPEDFIEPPDPEDGNVDLDVSNSVVKLADSQNQLKSEQPYSSVIEADVINHGPAKATNVTVEFFNGHPSNDNLIASTTIASIDAGETKAVQGTWASLTSPATANIYVKVDSNETEIDPSKNVSKKGTSAVVAFADFSYDPDTFHFENFGLNLEYFSTEFFTHLKPYGFLAYPYNLIPPFLYFLLGAGGNCYGFSTASMIYWDTPLAKPVDKPTYQMTFDDAKMHIQSFQVRQLYKAIPLLAVGAGNNPSNTFEQIRNKLEIYGEPSILSVKSEWWTGYGETPDGHSTLAYKVVEIGNQKYIFTYESSFPMNPNLPDYRPFSDVLILDENNNKLLYPDLGLEYEVALATSPVRSATEITAKMIHDTINFVLRSLINRNIQQGFFSWGDASNSGATSVDYQLDQTNTRKSKAPSHFLITDDLGNRLGYNEGVFVNEIPGAVFEDFGSAFYWLLPEDGDYLLETEGIGTQSAELSFATPISSSEINTIIYSDFDLPSNASVSTHFGQSISDWRIVIEGRDDVFPDYEQAVDLDEPIQSDFFTTTTSGITPLNVGFINQSTGFYNSCEWNFGDGNTSTDCNNPSHTYSNAGTYTVSLTVSGLGGEDTETKMDYIQVLEPDSGYSIFLPLIQR